MMHQFTMILLAAFSTLAGWKEYVNRKEHYKIIYPELWTPIKTETGVGFASPMEDEDSTFRESYNIITIDLSDDKMTVDEFNKMSLIVLKNQVGDSTIISTKEIMMGGQKGTEVIYMNYEEREFKVKQCFTLYRNTGYVFSFGGDPADFDLHEHIANTALQNMKFLK